MINIAKRDHPNSSPPILDPNLLEHARFRLRLIRPSDAKLDHEAVMSSASLLRQRFDDVWPTDEISVAQDQKNLQALKQFVAREAFV